MSLQMFAFNFVIYIEMIRVIMFRTQSGPVKEMGVGRFRFLNSSSVPGIHQLSGIMCSTFVCVFD